MQFLLRLSRIIDTISERIGSILIWALFSTVIISTVNAIVRKVFSIGSNAWLELQWYLFSAVFLLGAGYAFLHNAHVRIDFISARLSPRTRNIIDIAGILVFLTPLAWMLLYLSWPLFVNAWTSNEMSQNAGGLIRWPVLALVPLGMVLLLAQGASELVKRVAFLKGLGPDPLAHAETPQSQAIVEEPAGAMQK
ncbi:MAG TPA: TRAP transporter small permease subunit [Burkholderiaceae bacterium]|nr:TRAP transporter small permease subunit [Burkholderiaceae bacterium]